MGQVNRQYRIIHLLVKHRVSVMSLLLLTQFAPAWAVVPVFLESPQQRYNTNPHLFTEVSGNGKVTALTSDTVRINGVLYLLSQQGVEIKSGEYPYRAMELAVGMTVQFKGRQEVGDSGMPSITTITVMGR